MKRLLLFLCLFTLSICSMFGNCRLYIEDVELETNQNKVTVPIKAHFEHYVSAFQVDLELPDGLTVTAYDEADGLELTRTNSEGNQVESYPMVGVNQAKTRFLCLSSEADYYNGESVGAVKWSPNDYTMFYITLTAGDGFKGGEIVVVSYTTSGMDGRPWVDRCKGCRTTTAANVSVEGVTPDEPEPIDEHDVGYWLVVGSWADKNYIKMDKNYTYVRIVGSQGETSVPYHFRIDGIDYGAPSDGRATDMEDLFENPLFPVANNYSIASGHQYLLAVMGYPDREMSYIHAHYADGDGYDSVEEAITDRQVESIRYYNINGMELLEPKGVTIVVTTYTDGTRESAKIMK